MELKWFVVYTRPRWEKKVADVLSKNDIENYCPVNKVERRWSDRKKIVEEPLFTSYVFVRTTAKQHSVIRELDGIVNFVYWLGKPGVVRDEEIEVIRRFLNEYENVRIEMTSFNVLDRVKILNGPFMAMEGDIISVTSNTIRVRIPLMGCTIVAVTRTNNVNKVNLEAI